MISAVVVANSARGGNPHQAEIGQQANADAHRQTDEAADRKAKGCAAVGGGDTVEKQRDLAALAQDGNADHHRKRQQRLAAVRDRLAGLTQFAGHFPATMRHPGIVPGQHHHGDAENGGVEQFLPHAGKELRQRAGKGGDDAGSENARQHATADPTIAVRDRAGHREHDADDQSGFEHLAEDDDECGEHGASAYFTTTVPRAFSLYSSKNS